MAMYRLWVRIGCGTVLSFVIGCFFVGGTPKVFAAAQPKGPSEKPSPDRPTEPTESAALPGSPFPLKENPSSLQEAPSTLAAAHSDLQEATFGFQGDPFVFHGKQNIMQEAHFGLVNGKITVGIPFKQLGGVEGLWGPPYVSSDFRLTVQVMGRPIPTADYLWRPIEVCQQGRVGQIQVQGRIVLAAGKRAGLTALVLENRASEPQRAPIAFRVAGPTLDRTDIWEFAAATSRTPTTAALEKTMLLFQQGDLAIAIDSPGGRIQWDLQSQIGKMEMALAPKGRAEVYLVWAIGPRTDALADCRRLAADPAAALRQAEEDYQQRVRELFERLPRLESSNRALVDFYNRSLVHLIANQWNTPEFVVNPYYSTGSVRGGCVCSYLWNFGEVWEILPLFDPQGAREQIRQYFKTDITRHFAFMPVTGQAFGPLYPVNQEKIIGLVYYYVKITGDRAFLRQETAGKTTLDHVIANALYGDDPNRPVDLIDYGPSNSHLELRRGYPYNHVMPDLNGRRYQNYLWAAELAELEGRKDAADLFRRRAGELKRLLKERLWDRRTGWFWFIDGQGQKQFRYTVQMFKLFGSGVLDAEQEAALLRHLNSEQEFLSEFGLHSLAKTDPAYDPADIDNGGPGACTCFPPQIAERLYKSGQPESADNILRRILWWGQRMPYWGDSLVAERIDYRQDTPLQCTLDGATIAQCLIFGLFGLAPQWDGAVLVRPSQTKLADRIALYGVRMHGQRFDVILEKDQFQVIADGQRVEARVGQTIRLERGRPRLLPTDSREQ